MDLSFFHKNICFPPLSRIPPSSLIPISNEIRRHMHILIGIAESVAFLDLIWNFAYLVTQNDNYGS